MIPFDGDRNTYITGTVPVPFTAQMLLETLRSAPPPLAPVQMLYLRELPDVPVADPSSAGALFGAGMKCQICPFLPETVKDSDGNEVELLGIMVSGQIDVMAIEDAAARMVYLTGKVVKPTARV